MKIKDIKGFMVGAFVVASSLSVLAVVQIPNIFKPGDLITAEGMNQNFSSLKAGIDAVEVLANSKQSRVSGTCAVGSSIREVKADGTVTCQLDNGGSGGSSYSAGAGLKLAGTQFSVDSATVQSRVAGVCAAGSAIKEVKADGQVVCEAVGSTGGGVAGVSAVNGKTGGVTLESGSANLTVDNSQAGKVVFSVAGGSSYSAGLGLTLTGTQFLVDTNAIQARVSGVCAAGSSIQSINLDGTVTCQTDAVGAAFGAQLSGSSSGAGLVVNNGGAGGGLLGSSSSSTTNVAGVYGLNFSSTGQVVGVFGQATSSPIGTGVVGKGAVTGGYFQATGEPSGGITPVGIYGVAQSSQGVGIKAQNAGGGTALEVDGGIKVAGSNPAAFRVGQAGVGLGWVIDSPLSNNDPNVLIFFTAIGFPSYQASLYYNLDKKWEILCVIVPGGECPKAFNVLIIKQ